MKKHIITFLIVFFALFFFIAIFSIVFTSFVISHFNDINSYNKTLFEKDIELSLVIAFVNIIGDLVLFYFLWKKGQFRIMFPNLFKSDEEKS